MYKPQEKGQLEVNVRENPTLNCVVPARNEAGHLPSLIASILSVSEISQVVIVEGGSNDGTFLVAERLSQRYPGKVFCIKQKGQGKFNAVLEGALHKKSDFTLIWDADGTVSAECTRLIVRKAFGMNSFVIGDRLRGTRERGSMQFANWLGNWAFAVAWAPLIRDRPTDVFCGTKVGPTEVFERVGKSFRHKDPYGDLSLISSAITHGVPIHSVPVSYSTRRYGESKMRRWKIGAIFLRLTYESYRLHLKN
jgi:glycosyltransferase involved in cell wall biosynthesis